MEKRIAAAARVHDGAPAPPPDDERTHRSAAIPQAAPVRPSKAMAIRRPDAPGAESRLALSPTHQAPLTTQPRQLPCVTRLRNETPATHEKQRSAEAE